MHPEKIVFEQQNVSGIRFFLYDSQFGRFFNNGPIKGSGDPFFFAHTLLWAFLPWAFIAYYALFQKSRQLIKHTTKTEHYTYFGFMVMFLIFSISKFQLAHYLNPIFPLLAIICADAIVKASEKAIRILTMFQVATMVLLLLAVCCLIYFFQVSMLHIDTLLIMVVFIALGIFIFTRKNTIPLVRLIFVPALIVLSINYYLNREFYPELTKYQSETAVADYFLKEELPVDSLATLNFLEFGSSFKLNMAIPAFELNNVTRKAIANKYIFTSEAGLAKIDSFHLPTKIIKTFYGFHVTMLTGEFINKSTRASVLTPTYLVKLGR
jgi:4-amino-4-deoxy-L-arabinose transferase-like glycosyltransferase